MGRSRREVGLAPRDVHAHHRERLAQLVVQLARDARLLVLARFQYLRRELAQLVLLALQRVLVLLAQRGASGI